MSPATTDGASTAVTSRSSARPGPCNLCGTSIDSRQGPRWVKDGYEVFQCGSCGLLFRGNLPSEDELLSIYALDYFRLEQGGDANGYADYLGDQLEHRLTARRRVERLNRVTRRGRLLDVGAAAGFFMDEARKAGWEPRGIDVSPEMSAWGRDNLGLDIATGLFHASGYGVDTVDALTMWDYIEHSIDPARDFAKASEVLRPGGVLMLSTGDSASVVARLSGRRWHLLTPRHHNFFFTAKTLERYLTGNGFEVMSIKHAGAHYSLRYIVHKLGTMAPRSARLRRLSAAVEASPFGERSLRLNLFDIVTIVARRI